MSIYTHYALYHKPFSGSHLYELHVGHPQLLPLIEPDGAKIIDGYPKELPPRLLNLLGRLPTNFPACLKFGAIHYVISRADGRVCYASSFEPKTALDLLLERHSRRSLTKNQRIGAFFEAEALEHLKQFGVERIGTSFTVAGVDTNSQRTDALSRAGLEKHKVYPVDEWLRKQRAYFEAGGK